MKRINSILLLIISLSLTTLSAQKLQKPTNQKIVSLIKSDLTKSIDDHLSLVGFPHRFFKEKFEFKDIQVNSVKITKVGKAQNNYYEQVGNYINSHFYVKALVEGSAVLKKTYCFGESDVHSEKCSYKKEIKGEMPFRNVEHKFIISTDEYGDWYASYRGIANEKDEIDEDEYLEKIYLKKNPIKKKKVVKKGRGLSQVFIEEGKRQDKIDAEVRSENKKRFEALKRELSKQSDLKELAILNGKCVKEDWLWCGIEIADFENFYLPMVRVEKEHHVKLVKKKKTEFTSPEEHEKFVKILNKFFDKHPDVKKKFYSGYIRHSYLGDFSNHISIQKTEKLKYLVFLELSKDLMSIKPN